MHLQRVNGQGWCLLSANTRTHSVLSFWSPFRLRSTFISRGWIVHSLQPNESFALLQGKSLLSGAPDPGFLSSAFPGLCHEPAQAMGGSKLQGARMEEERERMSLALLCVRFSSALQLEHIPILFAPLQTRCICGGWCYSALLWRRSWFSKGGSSIPASLTQA